MAESLSKLYDETTLEEIRKVIAAHGRMTPGVREIADLLGVAGPPADEGHGVDHG